jgi:D-sedoheptulose 7-phosphate isomerase
MLPGRKRPAYTAEVDDPIATIKERLRLAARVSTAMADQEAASIAAAADLIATTFRAGGKLLLCGNGGSAADCQHMAAELVGRLTRDMSRPGLPAIALTTDTSFLTAYSNDFGFDAVFARQVQALGSRGDVLMTISTSGASPNVLAAVDEAKRVGLSIVALLGEAGPLADLADVAIRVPSRDTQLIQQVHLAVEHLICHLVERTLYP